jgi:hypothetical protein
MAVAQTGFVEESRGRPVQDWTAALNHLSIVFEGRIPV